MTKFLQMNEPMIPYVPMGIIGMKQAGKSLYTYENGYNVVAQEGGEILWLSTEEPTDFLFTTEIEEHKGWEKTFQEKYKVKPKIHWEYLPTPEDVMKYFGIEGKVIITEAPIAEVKVKDKVGESPEDRKKREEEAKTKADEKQKGIKMEFRLIKVDTNNSPFVDILKANDIRYVAFDSLAAAFDPLTMGGRQNFNIRAQMEESFLTTIQIAAFKVGKSKGKNIYIMTTNHLSNNPTDPFTALMDEKFYKEKGGKNIGHYIKVLHAVKKKDTPHGSREFIVVRFPNIAEYSKRYDLLITNDGFKTTSKEELAEVKAAQKEERVAKA
jgi:hypothetical protein